MFNGIGNKVVVKVLSLSLIGGWLGHAGESLADSGSTKLTVALSGFENSKAHAIVKLYRNGQDVLGPPYQLIRSVIRDNKASITFDDLTPGEYAVVAFHDENDNGKIDHNFLGMPTEALGFSNGFVAGITTGMPTWDKLKFKLDANGRSLNIKLD